LLEYANFYAVFHLHHQTGFLVEPFDCLESLSVLD